MMISSDFVVEKSILACGASMTFRTLADEPSAHAGLFVSANGAFIVLLSVLLRNGFPAMSAIYVGRNEFAAGLMIQKALH